MCQACEQPIGSHQMMMVLPGLTPTRLHDDCFQVWSEERRAFVSSD
jgi:hypothetical protein